MKLLPKERKLLLLATNGAAHPGEARNAAAAFVFSLKTRFGDGYNVLAKLEAHAESNHLSGVDYGHTILPFGKFRGSQIANVPPTYLIWVLENCDDLNQPLRKAISRFLRDREFPA
jgi:hypothetical protein